MIDQDPWNEDGVAGIFTEECAAVYNMKSGWMHTVRMIKGGERQDCEWLG